MPINQTFNGVTYPIPTQGQTPPWGPALDRYLIALGTYALAPSGGLFTLTADVNFGASFGLLGAYFSSRGTAASAGLLRLSKTDLIEWRNNANSGNLTLGVDGSDNLVYNGAIVPTGLGTLTDGKIWIGSVGNLPVAQTLTGDVTVTNGGVTAIGADKIVNSQVNSAAAIAYSKLNLSGSILNADIFSGAAIAFSKLASLTSAHILVGSGSNVATDVALSGDATLANTGALTLATVNSNVGSFTNASLTVNAKGLITAASNGTGTGTVTSVAMTVPTFLSIAGSPVTTSGTLAVTLSGTALPVLNGGTGVTTSTGSGNTVLSTSPTLVTPVLGAASATSLTFSSTSGIIGTTTNNNSAAGSVGEYIESIVSSLTAIPAVTNTFGVMTSISLTAGDWELNGCMTLFRNGATVTGPNGIFISQNSGSSVADAVFGSNQLYWTGPAVATTDYVMGSVPGLRVSLSGTATLYLKTLVNFSIATPQYVCRISARRIR